MRGAGRGEEDEAEEEREEKGNTGRESGKAGTLARHRAEGIGTRFLIVEIASSFRASVGHRWDQKLCNCCGARL